MKSIVLFALTFFIFQSSIIAQPTGDYKKLDTYLSTLYEKDKMLGSVAVMENGQIVFQKAYGTFDPNTLDDFSVNPETVYRIGSITKTFTATMILQLVEAGKLSLDTKLNTFFPDVCNAGSITIKNMLQHRSGIFNFTDDPVFLGYMREGRSKEEMLEVFNNLDCDFEPGTQTAYSNTGFVLLGYIIEQLDGRTYAESLNERIVTKLGLTRTYQGGPINEKNNEVKSFNLLSNRWEDATESDMFVPGGAGAIASTPSDLLTFFHALMNEQLINRTSLDQMMQTTDGFGLGVLTFPFYDKTAFGHNGGIDAFVSNAAYFPSDNVAISIVSNGLNVALNDVLIGILSCTFNKPFDIPSFEFLALSDAESTRCPATYVSSDLPLEIRIFVENGQLYAQATGQSAFTLEKTKDGAFEYKAANIKITFNWSEDGAVSGFVLNQHGQKYSYNPK